MNNTFKYLVALRREKTLLFFLSFLMSFGATSCFTGIESTPKITQRDVRRQNITDTPEQHILDSIVPARPSEWMVGKTFHITNNRAGLAMWRVMPLDSAGMLGNNTARITAIDTIRNLTGEVEVELAFELVDYPVNMIYRPGITQTEWKRRTNFDIPYFIDNDMVNQVSKRLVGKTYYILQSRRLTQNGKDTVGRRYDPVRITSVEPGNDVQPLMVRFVDAEGLSGAILMTIGDQTTSRRNFETIFAIDNPRHRYKYISDEHWDQIRNSRVAIGMTSEECRLALGSPDKYRRVPTTSGMAEQWYFTNGTYLLFEDGVLSYFK